jgi:hypothetical protein
MEQTTVKHRREQICFLHMPLAVYRELAAHLQQVEGVKTGLIIQQSQEFNYQQSQIDSLWIEFSADLDAGSQEYLEDILSYYVKLYGQMRRE